MTTTVRSAPAPTLAPVAESPAPAPAAGKPPRVRTPFNAARLTLDHPPIEGYHLAWIEENAIPPALAGGYEFVEKRLDNSDPVDRQGGADIAGRERRLLGLDPNDQSKPRYAYLMKIRNEWHEEDLDEIRARDAAFQAVLTRKALPDNIQSQDRSNFYHPKT